MTVNGIPSTYLHPGNIKVSKTLTDMVGIARNLIYLLLFARKDFILSSVKLMTPTEYI